MKAKETETLAAKAVRKAQKKNNTEVRPPFSGKFTAAQHESVGTIRRLLAASEFDDCIRVCRVLLILDCSGSEKNNQELIFDVAHGTLEKLAQCGNEDVRYLCKIVTFADTVTELNEDFLAPEHLLELFTPDRYSCRGGTNIHGIIEYLDQQFTRSSKMIQGIQKGDPRTTTLMITDFCGTDRTAEREQAMELLSRNQLFMKTNSTLCCFNGPESKVEEVLALCGSRDNLIHLDGNELSAYLMPVIINSTINLSDGTHIGGVCNHRTPREIATAEKRRAEKGAKGAKNLSDAELKEEFERLFSSVS